MGKMFHYVVFSGIQIKNAGADIACTCNCLRRSSNIFKRLFKFFISSPHVPEWGSPGNPQLIPTTSTWQFSLRAHSGDYFTCNIYHLRFSDTLQFSISDRHIPCFFSSTAAFNASNNRIISEILLCSWFSLSVNPTLFLHVKLTFTL